MRLLPVLAACLLSGCAADLASQALKHPGIASIDYRGGKLWEGASVGMRFRPAAAEIPATYSRPRELAIPSTKEVHDGYFDR